MSQLSGFAKLILAYIKGDEAEVIALKIEKKAITSLRAQIAIKENTRISLEESLEDAIEARKKATFNGGSIIDETNSYINNLFTANVRVEKARKELEEQREDIAFLQRTLDQIQGTSPDIQSGVKEG